MTVQQFHKNTIRHRKNSEWFQSSENSEKQGNDTKIKILKISINYHKPSLEQELEQFYKVTPCNEKCNFFILLSFILQKCISLLRIVLIGIISLCRDGTSLLVQLLNLLFCRRGFRSPILTTLHTRKIFHIHTTPNSMDEKNKKRHKIHPHFIIFANSCDFKKVAVNPV